MRAAVAAQPWACVRTWARLPQLAVLRGGGGGGEIQVIQVIYWGCWDNGKESGGYYFGFQGFRVLGFRVWCFSSGFRVSGFQSGGVSI